MPTYDVVLVRRNNGCGCVLIVLAVLVVVYFVFLVGESRSSYSGSGAVSSQEGNDLGITGSPIMNVGCDDSYLLVTHSVEDRTAVIAALSEVQGVKYLRTDQSCSSFAQSSNEGAPIYAIYLGPFDASNEALAHCSAGPFDAYVKKLDTAGSDIQRCSRR